MTPPRVSACPPRPSTTRSTTPSVSARSRPSSPSATSTGSCWRSPPTSSRARTRSPGSTSARRHGAQVPLSAFTRFAPAHDAAAGEPPGPVPGGDAVVQPGRGRGAGRRREGRPGRRAPGRLPRDAPRELPGHGPGLPGVAGQSADPDPGRADRGLPRPRRALREPHPSDHDPVHAALGRHRRDPRAAPVPHGPEHHRDDRPAPPHRDRQEERHPDDRLRGRRRPQPESDAAGRDLRGLPAALPADHDDDDGRPARRLAAGTRHRARLRAPPPAGRHHRGRADPVPAPDAVHDAGRLPVPRASPAVARPPPASVVRTESIEARA